MIQLVQYAEYLALSAEERICFDARRIFENEYVRCIRLLHQKKIVILFRIDVGRTSNVASLAKGIARTLLDLDNARVAMWMFSAGAKELMMLATRENQGRGAVYARAIIAGAWRIAGPQLADRLRVLQALARVRIARFVHRFVRRFVLIQKIYDGRCGGGDLLLGLLSAPRRVGGEREFHDAVRTFVAFLK